MEKINIPADAKLIIDQLEKHGYDAYVVGGCVRDSLIEKTPKDWDICTSASPDKMINDVFKGFHLIETGIKHGTVTIYLNGENYEVTTYRIDGEYEDNRHPKEVIFVNDIEADLSRRDFTINSIAFNPKTGIKDPFNGKEDIENQIIKCVGNPSQRFIEDGLRILRALRFSSVYGFTIDKNTEIAIHSNKYLLDNISKERISSELFKILCGDNCLDILLRFSDVIGVIIPELLLCMGFDQKNKYHIYNLYEHIVHSVSEYRGNDKNIKMALLLHDIGKPCCVVENETGRHFYEHGKISYNISKSILNELKVDNTTKYEVTTLIIFHDSEIPETKPSVKRWIGRLGYELFIKLLEVKIADIKAQNPKYKEERLQYISRIKEIADEIISQESCCTLHDLDISGNDIINLGVKQGKEIGIILKNLLDMVVNESIENAKDVLIEEAKHIIENGGYKNE